MKHADSPDRDPDQAPGRGLRARLLPRGDDGEALVAAAPSVALRTLLRRFWPFARPYKRQIALGMLFVALVPAIAAVEIWLFKVAIDEVVVPADLSPLAWIAPVVIGLTLLGGAFSFGEDYAWTWAGERFLLDLRLRFFAHVQGLSQESLDRRRSGDLLSRLSGDIQAIESFVLGGLAEIVSAAARILFFAGALALLDWRLALVTLVVLPPFALAGRWFARLAKHAAREKRRRSGSLNSVAEESLANAALVQSTDQAERENARLRREGEGIVQAELSAARVSGAFGPVVAIIELTGALSIMALGTWSIQSGHLTIGGLLAFLAYLSQLLRPISDLGHLAGTLFAAAAGGERVFELLDEEPSVMERPGAGAIGRARGAVEMDSVTFAYRDAPRPVLRDFDLEIQPGETLALTGVSGAGKSTVTRLLTRFSDPYAGTVRLDGHDLRDLTLSSVRMNVGYLGQETMLFDTTVRENLVFGRPDATQEEIEAAARAAGAHEFITALPGGYDGRVGPRGRALSGGQRRRLEIARTLLRDTPVVVLDEPTTGLDQDAVGAVGDSLRELLRDRSALLISHDPAVLRLADRTVSIDAVAKAAPQEAVV